MDNSIWNTAWEKFQTVADLLILQLHFSMVMKVNTGKVGFQQFLASQAIYVIQISRIVKS